MKLNRITYQEPQKKYEKPRQPGGKKPRKIKGEKLRPWLLPPNPTPIGKASQEKGILLLDIVQKWLKNPL